MRGFIAGCTGGEVVKFLYMGAAVIFLIVICWGGVALYRLDVCYDKAEESMRSLNAEFNRGLDRKLFLSRVMIINSDLAICKYNVPLVTHLPRILTKYLDGVIFRNRPRVRPLPVRGLYKKDAHIVASSDL